jgi:hypothetical protein
MSGPNSMRRRARRPLQTRKDHSHLFTRRLSHAEPSAQTWAQDLDRFQVAGRLAAALAISFHLIGHLLALI